jgi:Cu+-exporting ATPase
MNTLIALGTGSAFAYSLVATVAPGLVTAPHDARHAVMAPAVYYAVLLRADAVTVSVVIVSVARARRSL